MKKPEFKLKNTLWNFLLSFYPKLTLHLTFLFRKKITNYPCKGVLLHLLSLTPMKRKTQKRQKQLVPNKNLTVQKDWLGKLKKHGQTVGWLILGEFLKYLLNHYLF
ncbi:hypothetical protein FHS57_006424 [Runella defluvii]|uniref:Uncharacterized protein n=1 Tax=Runella defluvii TaxID=370973 RepID=A0A7W5ZSM5_9BACT|nr:hypothetical protein [Runella defluvii]MBB3842393.1 hypothetical protein [Runella defluvii]